MSTCATRSSEPPPPSRGAEAEQVVELTKVVELIRTPRGLGLRCGDDGLGQCRVVAIGPDSQAERSGSFAVHDRLVALNGQPLTSYATFKEKLAAIAIGAKVAIEIAIEIAPAALAAIEAATSAGGAAGGPKDSLVTVTALLPPPPPPSSASPATEPRAERALSTPERAVGDGNQRGGARWGPRTPTDAPPEHGGGGGVGGTRAPRPAAISLGPSQAETEGPASPQARQHQWLSDEITQIDLDETADASLLPGPPPEGWATCEDGGFVRVGGETRPQPRARTLSFSAKHVPSMLRRQSSIEARLQAPAPKHVPSVPHRQTTTEAARLQSEGGRMFGRLGASSPRPSSRPSSPALPPSRTPLRVSPPKIPLSPHGPPPIAPLDTAALEPRSSASSPYSERAYSKLDGAILDPTPAAMRYNPDQEPPQVTHAAAPPCPSDTTYAQRTPPTPLPLTAERRPPLTAMQVILSYASNMCGGQGKSLMWSLVNELHRRNITVFATPMTPTGEAWDDYFFGQLPHAKAFVALFCPAYFESDKCKHELARAYKANVRIMPLLFEDLPAQILQMQPGWMGESPADVRLGNNVKGGVGQMLPEPGETFEQEWTRNVDKLASEILGLPLSSQLGIAVDKLASFSSSPPPLTDARPLPSTSPSKPAPPALGEIISAAASSTYSVRASASLPPASPTLSSSPEGPSSPVNTPQNAVDEAAADDDDSEAEAARRVVWIRYHLKLGNYNEATELGWDGAPPSPGHLHRRLTLWPYTPHSPAQAHRAPSDPIAATHPLARAHRAPSSALRQAT